MADRETRGRENDHRNRPRKSVIFKVGHTVTVLDGSRLRTTISQTFGFSIEDKRESRRRGAAAVAELLNEQGKLSSPLSA